jgi:hypothetical protein
MFTFVMAVIAGDEDENWGKFSQSLVEMFNSDNEGLKQSAMMQIIVYSDKLNVQEAAFDIYNIYKFHKNIHMRHLALVTLYHLNYEWAMNQLVKESKIEQSPILKKQLIYMVNEYNKSKQHTGQDSLVTD